MAIKQRRNAFEAFVKKLPGHDLDAGWVLPLDKIELNPVQARQVFDEAALAELTESVRQHGVLQPIGVQRVGESFRIVFGERRYRAAVAAGLTEIPVIVYENLTEDGAAIVTALENLQREDLDLEDEARQFVRLLEVTGLSQRKLAETLGKTVNYVSRRVRLLKELPESFDMIREGVLTQREALEQVADEKVYHGGTPSPPAERTPRTEMPDVRATPSAAAFKRLHTFQNQVRRLAPDQIPPEDRGDFRRTIEGLIDDLTALHQALDAEA